jgi:copper homeostasis protein
MGKKKFLLEVCVFSPYAAMDAAVAGADRIELCENIAEGGTTPSFGAVKTLKKILSIPLHPMVRPRGGDFLYSDFEFEVMKANVEAFRNLGAEGVVFGILCEDGSVDIKRCTEVVKLAHPMKATFHRAFDFSRDQFRALEDIISCGFSRVLTSGGKNIAYEGTARIKELVKAAGNRIIIVPGGGINIDNILEIAKKTGAHELHMSAKSVRKSGMHYRNPSIVLNGTVLPDGYSWYTARSETIKSIREKLDSVR